MMLDTFSKKSYLVKAEKRIKHFEEFDFVIVDFEIVLSLEEACTDTVFVEL